MSRELLRKVRSSLCYQLAGSMGCGGRVWHAPAPTRYGFAVQGADHKALFKPDPLLDARWTASAWVWALPLSTTATRTQGAVGTNLNGRPGDDAIWRALLDIRKFAERVDNRALSQSQDIRQIIQLVRAIATPRVKKSTIALIVTAVFLLFFYSYHWANQTIRTAVVDQFLVDRVNNIATDPETQDTLRKLMLMLADVFNAKFNPVQMVRGMFGKEEAIFQELVEKKSAVALNTLLVLLLVDGPSFDTLVENLNVVGKEDPATVREVLGLLEKGGYVEVVDTHRKVKTYWPTMLARNDSKSGKLDKQIKNLVKLDVKAALRKSNVPVPESE